MCKVWELSSTIRCQRQGMLEMSGVSSFHSYHAQSDVMKGENFNFIGNDTEKEDSDDSFSDVRERFLYRCIGVGGGKGGDKKDCFRAPHHLFRLNFILDFLIVQPPDGLSQLSLRVRVAVVSTTGGFIDHSVYIVFDVYRHSDTALSTRVLIDHAYSGVS